MIQLKTINLDTTFTYFKQTYAFIDSQTTLHLSGYYLNNYFNVQEQINLNNIPYNTITVNSNTINITYITYDALANNLSFTNILPTFTTPNIIAFELLSYQNMIISNTNLIITSSSIQNISGTLSSLSAILNNISASCSSISTIYYNTLNYNSNLQSNIQNAISSYSAYLAQSHTYSIYVPPIYLNFNGNVTYWSTIYSLSLNQSLIISFTNSQTLFIPLQLTGNDIYKLHLTQNVSNYSSGANGSGVFLYPNNASVNVIYTALWVYYNENSAAYATNDYKFSGFFLAWGLGSTEATIINSSPFTKTVIVKDLELGIYIDPNTHLSAQIWDDYTTNWTMFGTITLPQVASGFIVITREV